MKFPRFLCSAALLPLPLALTLVGLGTAAILPTAALAQNAAAADAEAGPEKVLLDVSKMAALQQLKTETKGEVTWESTKDAAGKPAIAIKIQPGKAGYPGVIINPPADAWDLSEHGHIKATLTNTGETAATVALRVDNSGGGPEPWNTEQAAIKPGETKTIKLIFGHSYGQKPAYKLDPSRVVKMLLFVAKPKGPVTIRIDSLTAGGQPGEKPAVKPEAIRIAPVNNVLFGEGGVALDKFKTTGDAISKLEAPGTWQVQFPGSGRTPFAALKPAVGEWDLREGLQVTVTVKNTGFNPVTPALQMHSRDKKSDKVTAAQPLAPSAELQMVVPFFSEEPWDAAAAKSSGSQFLNNHGTGLSITLAGEGDQEKEAFLEVSRVELGVPPVNFPEWLGERPPVQEGEWELTLDENFDGPKLDEKVWSMYGSNFWDKKTYFTKDNLIFKDGTVTLRVSKKRGFHNDDPKDPRGQLDYAAGFLESYGKFTQKYGYWEARMKLTKSPGVWPAFWLMPDRGEELGPQWKRADTKNGGMEFDIMEQLSGWGIYRYNIAMHWDGYQKDHKATGSTSIYAQPDEEGYITAGLLWLPGKAIFYANGKEVGRNITDRISNVESNILFTIPIGGWDNLPLDDAQLPADFVIDYVRVWQRKDLQGK